MSLTPPEPELAIVDGANAVARGVVSGVPLVGGLLVEILGFATNRGREVRLYNWMAEVARCLEQLGLRVKDLESNDAYLDAIGAIARAACETSDADKLLALRNAVLNSAIPANVSADRRSILVDMVSRLTPSHLRVLRTAADLCKESESERIRAYTSMQAEQVLEALLPELSEDAEMVPWLLSSLLDERLIGEWGPGTMWGPGMYTPRPTSMGLALIEFISAPEG